MTSAQLVQTISDYTPSLTERTVKEYARILRRAGALPGAYEEATPEGAANMIYSVAVGPYSAQYNAEAEKRKTRGHNFNVNTLEALEQLISDPERCLELESLMIECYTGQLIAQYRDGSSERMVNVSPNPIEIKAIGMQTIQMISGDLIAYIAEAVALGEPAGKA